MKNPGKWYEIIGRPVMDIYRQRVYVRTPFNAHPSAQPSHGSTPFVRYLASSAMEYSCKIRKKSSVKKWKSVYDSPGIVGIEIARLSTYPSSYKLRAIKSLHSVSRQQRRVGLRQTRDSTAKSDK